MYTKYNFDFVTEETTNQGISKFVNFENTKLTDYSICKTNKVLKLLYHKIKCPNIRKTN